MKRLAYALASACWTFGAYAAGETSEVENTNTAVTPQDPVANTKSGTTGTGDENAKAFNSNTDQDNKKPYDRYSGRLKSIDGKLAELEARMTDSARPKRPEFARVYGQARRQHATLKQEIDAMKNAPGDRWSKSKASLDKRFEELEGSLEKALN